MAFKKTYKKKYTAKPKSAMAKASKALSMVKQVKSVTKPEFKYQDYVRTDFQSALNSWEIADVPFAGIIPAYEDKGGRIGDQIYAQRYSATIRLKLPLEDGAISYGSLRFVLCRIKNLTGSASVSTTEVFANDNISSYLTWDKRHNLTKLWDTTVALTFGGVSERTIKISKNIRSKVQYINAGQAAVKNQLILFVIGDETAISAATSIQYLINSRVTYTDS